MLIQTQARKVLANRFLDLSSRHAAKSGFGSTGRIHSLSTYHRYSQALGQAGKWLRIKHGLSKIEKMTPEMARSYLDYRLAEGIGQKQLDNDRTAMQFMTGKLERVTVDKPEQMSPRAYKGKQAARIVSRQTSRNALSTKIAYNAGLRAHELLTLRRADEVSTTTARQWREDLFAGRIGERYVVTGKGGLTRQIMIHPALARELEARRLPQPVDVKDRKINYQRYYDIGGGQAWSQSFSNLSKKELGWSTGAHGLRHSYAHERYDHLLRLGYSRQDARHVLSQELGHFRPSIVDFYLR